MEVFFEPKSLAVIGASKSPGNLGATICNFINYMKYECRMYAVNTKGESVMGCEGFTSVLDIPDEVDLAVIITPAEHVPGIAKECGRKGILRLIVESSGFSEEGDAGILLQEELDAAAAQYGIRYIGPNCLGVMNTHNRFCCFFGFVPGMYDLAFENPGTVSYIIQSGGIGVLAMDSFQADVTDVNKLISIGNKADIDESDMMAYMNEDNTEVIGMYLENVRNGRKLVEMAKKVTKPVLVYKVGKTGEGASAAMSHTAGMANNDVIFDNACRQAGIIRLRSISELYTLPKIFTEMPILRGKKIAIISNSGAFGGIASDLLVEEGFEIPVLSQETQDKLKKTGKLYNVSNPVDIGPALSIQTFNDIFDILLSSGEIDGLMPVPNVWQEVVIEAIIELIRKCQNYGKPAAIYIPNSIERILSIRKKYRVPVFESPEEAVRALAVSYQHYRYKKIKETHDEADAEGSHKERTEVIIRA